MAVTTMENERHGIIRGRSTLLWIAFLLSAGVLSTPAAAAPAPAPPSLDSAEATAVHAPGAKDATPYRAPGHLPSVADSQPFADAQLEDRTSSWDPSRTGSDRVRPVSPLAQTREGGSPPRRTNCSHLCVFRC